jgi:quinol monooxygenase YgiN
MITAGLFIRVEGRPGKAADIEVLLKSAADRVREEGLAVAWFALRLSPAEYVIFDVFTSEADRDAHLQANAAALRAAGGELFAAPPSIEYTDVLAAVLPGE